MFDGLVNERRFERNKLSEEIDFNNLIYYYTDKVLQLIFFSVKVQ